MAVSDAQVERLLNLLMTATCTIVKRDRQIKKLKAEIKTLKAKKKRSKNA